MATGKLCEKNNDENRGHLCRCYASLTVTDYNTAAHANFLGGIVTYRENCLYFKPGDYNVMGAKINWREKKTLDNIK